MWFGALVSMLCVYKPDPPFFSSMQYYYFESTPPFARKLISSEFCQVLSCTNCSSKKWIMFLWLGFRFLAFLGFVCHLVVVYGSVIKTIKVNMIFIWSFEKDVLVFSVYLWFIFYIIIVLGSDRRCSVFLAPNFMVI